jgi:hypothetical protein
MRSTAQHLCVEYMKHYRNGSFELCKMVIVASINFFKKTFTHSHCIMILTLSHHNFILAFQIRNLKKKGALPADTVDNIDPKMSPAQNFIILNRVTGCRRCLSPMSSIDSNFVNFSELELTKIFWQDPLLCRQLQEYAFPDFSSLQIPEQVSLVDVGMWIGRVEPGFLINKFLTDIGGYDEDERKKKKNFSKSARRMTLADIRGHLCTLRQDSFDPSIYTTKGYLLRGSIKTDGFRLQVLSFKLNELNCVKYRRLPPDRLPDRITSTLGGSKGFGTVTLARSRSWGSIWDRRLSWVPVHSYLHLQTLVKNLGRQSPQHFLTWQSSRKRCISLLLNTGVGWSIGKDKRQKGWSLLPRSRPTFRHSVVLGHPLRLTLSDCRGRKAGNLKNFMATLS